MKEEFLHYLWKYNLYDPERLLDNEGKKIVVLNPGEYNRDSGPDFFNARLRIDGTEWAGNVEIHTRASQFDMHGHNTDPAYDNVILHVVGENDKKVLNSRGEELLTSEMPVDEKLYDRYVSLVNNPFVIACQDEVKLVDMSYIRHWLSALLIERLQDKTEQILKIFSDTGNDWEETFYRVLTRYFGFRVNTEPFERLAKALPFRIIRKHSDNIFQVEALLFGTAGLLDEGLFRSAISEDYYLNLVKEYKILSAKYSNQQLHGWIWKFARLRPPNFPTVRISQLAAMLSKTGGVFSRSFEAGDTDSLKNIFEVRASEYWDNHYVFGKMTRRKPKRTGSQATDILLINAVIPVIFVYGKSRGLNNVCEKALSFLDEIDPEQNSIIDEWNSAGISSESAFWTQALIQLRNNYCKKRRCLECRIGCRIISMGRKLKQHDELILEP